MKPTPSQPRPTFLTEQQRTALASGDATAMQAADDAALADAILASLAEQEDQTVQSQTVTDEDLLQQAINDSLAPQDGPARAVSATEDWREQQRKNTDKLSSWLDAHGFDVVSNGGAGHNDCLLISLLQHATGDYESEHAADVEACREFLNKLDPTIQRDDALPSMSDAISKLVDELNREKGRELRFAIVAPGLKGEPTYHFYGKARDEAEGYVMIFDQSGHYEAVVPRRAHRS